MDPHCEGISPNVPWFRLPLRCCSLVQLAVLILSAEGKQFVPRYGVSATSATIAFFVLAGPSRMFACIVFLHVSQRLAVATFFVHKFSRTLPHDELIIIDQNHPFQTLRHSRRVMFIIHLTSEIKARRASLGWPGAPCL